MPDASPEIFEATAAADIAACFPVMRELRPHLKDADELVERVREQQAEGYRLVGVRAGGQAVACAGFRVQTMLSRGRFLYVDDLVSLPQERSLGHGARLLDWLAAEALRLGCGRLHLDSGVQRAEAHRFYFRERMTISAYHFGKSLG